MLNNNQSRHRQLEHKPPTHPLSLHQYDHARPSHLLLTTLRRSPRSQPHDLAYRIAPLPSAIATPPYRSSSTYDRTSRPAPHSCVPQTPSIKSLSQSRPSHFHLPITLQSKVIHIHLLHSIAHYLYLPPTTHNLFLNYPPHHIHSHPLAPCSCTVSYPYRNFHDGTGRI